MNDAFTQSILIVDDDPMSTELFGEILSQRFHVEIANSVAEAQRKIAAGNIGIVLSDYHLGRQDANDFFAWLLDVHPDLEQRFILLTGDTVADLSNFKAKATVLYKPVDIGKLLTTVMRISLRDKE